MSKNYGHRGKKRKSKRKLSVVDLHQLRVAQDTLKMSDPMARIMGGPTKEEADEIIKRLLKKQEEEGD